MAIDPSKKGLIIGRGGCVIKNIISTSNCKIDIKDDIYLTEFVSDSREDYGNFFTKNGDSTNLGVYEFHY